MNDAISRGRLMRTSVAGAVALCFTITCRSGPDGAAPGERQATATIQTLQMASGSSAKTESGATPDSLASTEGERTESATPQGSAGALGNAAERAVTKPATAEGGDAGSPVTADAIPIEEFLARMDACDVESCRRELLVARVEGLPLPPKPAWKDFSSRLASCETEECVIELFPVEQKPPIGLEGCEPLDQRISKETFPEDLGLVCRARVARALAARRKQFPCKDLAAGNADFTIGQQQDFRLLAFNDLLSRQKLRPRGLSVSLGSGKLGGGTIQATYVLDRALRDSQGADRGQARVYFCMSGEPQRYHPYFFAWVRGGEPRADMPDQGRPEIAVMSEYIEKPPAKAHVAYQLGDWKSQAFRQYYELSDLDGDGVEDFVLVEQFNEANGSRYELSSCLYRPRASDCSRLNSKVRFNGDAASSPATRWSQPLLAIDKRVLTISLKDDSNQERARARFRVTKGRLVQID